MFSYIIGFDGDATCTVDGLIYTFSLSMRFLMYDKDTSCIELSFTIFTFEIFYLFIFFNLFVLFFHYNNTIFIKKKKKKWAFFKL